MKSGGEEYMRKKEYTITYDKEKEKNKIFDKEERERRKIKTFKKRREEG